MALPVPANEYVLMPPVLIFPILFNVIPALLPDVPAALVNESKSPMLIFPVLLVKVICPAFPEFPVNEVE